MQAPAFFDAGHEGADVSGQDADGVLEARAGAPLKPDAHALLLSHRGHGPSTAPDEAEHGVPVLCRAQGRLRHVVQDLLSQESLQARRRLVLLTQKEREKGVNLDVRLSSQLCAG